jgi:hypothetical protein
LEVTRHGQIRHGHHQAAMDHAEGIGVAFLGTQDEMMAAIFQQAPIERSGGVLERVDRIVNGVTFGGRRRDEH